LAVSNTVAVLLLVVGLVIGAGGLFVVQNSPTKATTTESTTVTTIESTTLVSTTTQFSATPQISTTTLTLVSTTTTTVTGPEIYVAQVSTIVTSCYDANGTCHIALMNTGNLTVSAISCSFTGKDGGLGFMFHGGQVVAGGSLVLSCQTQAKEGIGVGSAATGAVGLSDGGSAPFSGTWQ
jgi:hypothetical protein